MTLSLSALRRMACEDGRSAYRAEVAASLPSTAATAMFCLIAHRADWRSLTALHVRDLAWNEAAKIEAHNPTPGYKERAEGYRRLAEAVED